MFTTTCTQLFTAILTDGRTGETLLHRAIARGDEFAAGFLVQNGADLTFATRDGSTPLHYVAKHGLLPIAEELLKRGADINRQDGGGNTPTHVAIQNRHAHLTKLFLGHPKVDINARNAQVRSFAMNLVAIV